MTSSSFTSLLSTHTRWTTSASLVDLNTNSLSLLCLYCKEKLTSCPSTSPQKVYVRLRFPPVFRRDQGPQNIWFDLVPAYSPSCKCICLSDSKRFFCIGNRGVLHLAYSIFFTPSLSIITLTTAFPQCSSLFPSLVSNQLGASYA